jgi:predicted component of type VI protein secretion system
MNVLKSVENAIAGLLEGGFGRIFRSEVRPQELARKLAREMDAHRETTLSRTYAPNEYSVWLSPQDRARYEGIEDEVIEELCAYLLEHARQEEFVLATAPKISIHTDEDLALGEFGIAAQLTRRPEAGDAGAPAGRARTSPSRDPFPVRAEPAAPPPASAGAKAGAGETIVWSGSERVQGPLSASRERRAAAVIVRDDGTRETLAATGATLGRSRACEIVVDDPGVSRRHAEIRRGADGWIVKDLESTNGVSVNGRQLTRPQLLADGDEIELGSTAVRFEEL